VCVLGHPNTLPITVDEMVYHCKAVTEAPSAVLWSGDIPSMSYEARVADVVRNAGWLVKKAGVDTVKIESSAFISETAHAISESGIPVHGLIGLTPQKVKQLGEFKTQGETFGSAMELVRVAKMLSDAGHHHQCGSRFLL